MSGELFDPARGPERAPLGPLADRMRPQSFDELVGQPHLLTPGSPLALMRDAVVIVVIAGVSPGLRWELEAIAQAGHQSKLLVLMPEPHRRRVRTWQLVGHNRRYPVLPHQVSHRRSRPDLPHQLVFFPT